jgi:tRNA/rRNA methyltransferase
MADSARLENIAVVLKSPRIPENIGAAARAMCNMGIGRLVVVDPQRYDLVRVLKLATHAAAHVVERARITDTLEEALAPFHYVVGTTARTGGQRRALSKPGEMARRLVPISQKNSVALLFGPEDRGLSNVDLRSCHALVNIPTADFSSLNLAQAVMVLCYAIFSANSRKTTVTPRLASRHELDGMYAQLKELLVRISYLNPDNPDYWLNRVRYFLNRYELRAGEVSIIRGFCRQVDWYGRKCFQDGLESRPGSPEDEQGPD